MPFFELFNPPIVNFFDFPHMEKTLIILKPCTIQRGLIGKIIYRFERKGLFIRGLKMMCLSDDVLNEHYSHLKGKPFFSQVKDSMQACPVIVMCIEGIDAVSVVRNLTGATSGRIAQPGTIRGDFSMSVQENIVHASDSLETAAIELNRFFKKEEVFDYDVNTIVNLYASDER